MDVQHLHFNYAYESLSVLSNSETNLWMPLSYESFETNGRQIMAGQHNLVLQILKPQCVFSAPNRTDAQSSMQRKVFSFKEFSV